MWKDLAPNIHRQRLVIEGEPVFSITAEHITEYLSGLSDALDMKTLAEPVTHESEKFGWAGWIHWESSGCHFYAWDRPQLFFSADIYTCKPFDVETAVEFTRNFFKSEDLVYKSV